MSSDVRVIDRIRDLFESRLAEAAATGDATRFADEIVAQHKHILPLAPHRRSHHGKITLLEAAIENAFTGATSDHALPEYVLQVLQQLLVSGGLGKKVCAFGGLGSLFGHVLTKLAQPTWHQHADAAASVVAVALDWLLAPGVLAAVCDAFGIRKLPAATAALALYAEHWSDEPSVAIATIELCLRLQAGLEAVAAPVLAKLLSNAFAEAGDTSLLRLLPAIQDLIGADMTRHVESLLVDQLISIGNTVSALVLATSFGWTGHALRHVLVAEAKSRMMEWLRLQRWRRAAETAAPYSELQQALVDHLYALNPALASIYAQRFNITPSMEVAAGQSVAASTGPTLPLALHLSSVHLVNTAATAAEFCDWTATLPAGALVGLDAEWRPVVFRTDQARPSLLQLASVDQIFLLDLLQLPHMLEGVSTGIHTLFSRTDLLKVGFAVAGDFQNLARTFSHVGGFQCCRRVLELQALQPHVGRGAAGEQDSLSNLAHAVCGAPLDKTMQSSDWELRPLSAAQILYAAQDAHVLVRIASSLQACLTRSVFEGAVGDWFVHCGKQLQHTSRVPWWDELQPMLDMAIVQATAAAVASLDASTGGSRVLKVSECADRRVTPTVSRVARLLGSVCGLGHELLVLSNTSATAAQLATDAGHFFGVGAAAVLKSVAFVVGALPVIVVLSSSKRVRMEALAAELGVPQSTIRQATLEECTLGFGHVPGTVPPCCLRVRDASCLESFGWEWDRAATLVDSAVLSLDTVVVGAGAAHAFTPVKPAELVAVCGAQVASLTGEATPAHVPPAVGSDNAVPAMLADATIGRLIKWLRMVRHCVRVAGVAIGLTAVRTQLGVDVEESLSPSQELMSELAATDRVLLTRSIDHAGRKLVRHRCIYLKGSKFDDLLREMIERFPLLASRQQEMMTSYLDTAHAPFSRCSKCNGPGFVSLDKADAVDRVAPHTLRTATELYECVRCHQVFWPGSIYGNAKQKMALKP